MDTTITCACGCGRTGPHEARGLTKVCYARARRRGVLHRYPLWSASQAFRDRRAASIRRAHRTHRDARIEDYVHLRETGETRHAAESRLGVTHRTTTRWHSTLRAQGATYSWLPPMPAYIRTTQKEPAA